MKYLVKSNHGEPTNFDLVLIIVLLMVFGLIWSVNEKGWVGTLLEIFK